MSTNVKNYTDLQILDRVANLRSFRGFSGMMDFWIRSQEDEYDVFDDKVYTFDCNGQHPQFVGVNTGTSNAGAEGLKHYDRYNGLGCAILKADELVYDSHVYGFHKGKYAAYVQAKPFPYFRDGNKNNRAEEIGKIYLNIIGANCHKAGWFSTRIGGWSVACLVRNQQAQYDAWMKTMNKRRLSVAILQEW
jgi:hypothetical protein